MSFWTDEQIKKCQDKMKADIDKFLEVDHLVWMYRATGDDRYLKELKKLFENKKE